MLWHIEIIKKDESFHRIALKEDDIMVKESGMVRVKSIDNEVSIFWNVEQIHVYQEEANDQES